jgi:multidrug efflux pump subunit AcrA (membrane-fusion protein)
MDIKKSTNIAKSKHRSIVISFSLVIVICLSIWSFTQPAGNQKVSANQIWTDKVKQGDLALQVEGYGKLKSKEQRLLSAPSNAIVEEILLKPGALVNANSVILRLSNPEVAQQVKDAHRELNTYKTNILQLSLNQQREILSQQGDQEALMSQLEIAALKVEAEQKLVVQGIISGITFKRSQLDHRQLSRRIEIEQKRLLQLNEVHQQELEIAQDKIEQQQEQVAVIQERFDKLTVKAGIKGVVQNLPVELGQSVVMGEQVALVGSIETLYAMLNISQSDMALVELNQAVVIDTRGGTIHGEVIRINPVVTQGSIAVEIALNGALPSNARPELNVDGVISTGLLTNATYIKKPVNASAGKRATLFKLSNELNQAEQVEITYGQESGEYIQIVSGAIAEQTFVLSDMSRWQEVPVVTIIDQ